VLLSVSASATHASDRNVRRQASQGTTRPSRLIGFCLMAKVRFQARLAAIGSHTILKLPTAASGKLPSRGMSMVEGTLNGHAFQAPLEPDGTGSHWFRVSTLMLKAA